jgi:hypothetical protein
MKVDIVFDGPPGPDAGRFVEVENQQGQSIRVGKWVQRPDGYWALRLDVCDDGPHYLATGWASPGYRE